MADIDDSEAKDMTSGVYPPLFHYLRKFGIYVMRLFKDGNYRYVVIDGRLPVKRDTDEVVYS